MSKLNIVDLERIKNGELVRYNFGYKKDYSKEITLQLLDTQIKDLRYIRNYILNTFKKDVRDKFDRAKGDRIETEQNVDFDPRMLFLSKYLCLTVPTMFGDTTCLLSKKGIENATFDTSELREKVQLIFSYIQGILDLNEKSNVLDNIFYNDMSIFDENYERQFIANGDGIFLPFRDYDESENNQDLPSYYYQNGNKILKNVIVPDEEMLDIFRTNVSLQKALAIYKGIR